VRASWIEWWHTIELCEGGIVPNGVAEFRSAVEFDRIQEVRRINTWHMPSIHHCAHGFVARLPLAAGAWAILDRFGQLRGADGLAVGQVGDGARQLEHAVEGARRELQPLHRRAK
jgi:hypothetical protein